MAVVFCRNCLYVSILASVSTRFPQVLQMKKIQSSDREFSVNFSNYVNIPLINFSVNYE